MDAVCTNLEQLSPRMREVMVALVEEYIETAQPVSSSRVLERSGLAVSSATVRNSMGELAELQLLEQPHPSAGRVPTDRAFRLYVDGLLEAKPPETVVSNSFRTALAGAAGLDDLRGSVSTTTFTTADFGTTTFWTFGQPAERASPRSSSTRSARTVETKNRAAPDDCRWRAASAAWPRMKMAGGASLMWRD